MVPLLNFQQIVLPISSIKSTFEFPAVQHIFAMCFYLWETSIMQFMDCPCTASYYHCRRFAKSALLLLSSIIPFLFLLRLITGAAVVKTGKSCLKLHSACFPLYEKHKKRWTKCVGNWNKCETALWCFGCKSRVQEYPPPLYLIIVSFFV